MEFNNKKDELLKKFIKENRLVLTTGEIDKSYRKYLIENEDLINPLKGIYLIIKNGEKRKDAIKNNIFGILEKIDGIISGEIVVWYFMDNPLLKELGGEMYLNKVNTIYIYGNINYKVKIGDFLLIFRKSKVIRNTKKIKINGKQIEIETLESYIVNNNKEINNLSPENHIDILNTLLNINKLTISLMIQKGFKLSGISFLAKLFKKYKYLKQYEIIKNEISKSGRFFDYKKQITDKPKKNKK